jgi:hypothetical protein
VDLHKRLGISDSLLDAVKSITEKKKMDPVDPKANQKDFDDRKDKDIDNDGDVDKTDKYLHRRRKAVTKSVKGEARKNGKKDQVETEPSFDNEVGVNEAKKKISKNYAKMLKSQGKFDSSKHEVEEADGVAPEAIDKHNCATHVYHEQYGNGQPVYSMHANPDKYGLIEWYDVMFEHGIEKRVPTKDMTIISEMSHGNHKKKK